MNKKLKNPDLTRFGFYLYPKVYRATMGFDKAHGLLLLDSTGRIEEAVADDIGLVRLLNSSTAVLYAINPVDGKYPNASELLKSLSLGSVAKQRLITKEELRREFLEQCSQCNIVIDLLDKAVRLGVNRDGHVVYESKAGRYKVDEKGESHRILPTEELLYAVSDNGELNDAKIRYCLESLFKFHLSVTDDELDFIDAGDFTNFVQTVTRCPPPRLPKMGDYDPISFYGGSNSISVGASTAKIIDVLETLEAQLMLDFDFDDNAAFEQYFHHIYNRSLPATSHGYKTNMPSPLLIVLLRLMSFNLIDDPHVYVPSVGNMAMLAGLIKLKESGITITACERLVDKKSAFNDFLKEALENQIEVVSSTSIQGFDGCIGYMPLGDEASSVLIPDSDCHTYKKSLVMMLDLLERRNLNGRSIFIAPVDSEGSLGRLDEDSTMFVRHLYQNYQNVLIFDCNQVLSAPTRNTCEYRIYVIGERIEDYSLLNTEDLAELILNPRIKTVDDPESFYIICDQYANEIAAVEISSVDLMDNLMDIIEDDEGTVVEATHNQDSPQADDKPTTKAPSEDKTEIKTDDESVVASTDNTSADSDTDNTPSDASTTEESADATTSSDDATEGSDNAGSSDTTSDTTSGGGRSDRLTQKPAPENALASNDDGEDVSRKPADNDNDDTVVHLDDDANDNNIIIIGGGDNDTSTDDTDLAADDFEEDHEFEEPNDDIEFDDPEALESKVESQTRSVGLK
jgi:hypothetical protein